MSSEKTIEKMETKKIKKTKTKKESKQKWPKVAIIILNWNGWKDTIECLESVFRNTYPNYQVIVVDNGSTDDSVEKIKAWADGKQEVLTPEPTHPLYHLSHPPVKKPIPYIYYTREEAEKGGNFKLEEKVTKEWQEQKILNSKELYPTSDYPLIFIQTGENLGFAGGNNVGIRHVLAKGNFDYIWLLNNDTVVDKSALIEMIKLAESNKSIGICGSKLLKMNHLKIIDSTGHIFKWGKIVDRGEGQIDKGQYDNRTNIIGAMAAACLYRTEMLKDISLFDESFFMQYEDAELSWRAYLKGWRAKFVHQSIVYHKRGGTKARLDTLHHLSLLNLRNTIITVKRHGTLFQKLQFIIWFGGSALKNEIKKRFKKSEIGANYFLRGLKEFYSYENK